jgi:hypothetical protein
MMAGGCGETPIAREQRSIESFGKGNVDGVVSREIVPQIPDSGQKEVVRISAQGEIREVGESRATAFVVDLAIRCVSANHLRDLDIEQMRRVQRLSRIE